MKILVVTAYFHPFTHPRAYRWTEIAAEWAAAGHEVHILTARHPAEKSVSELRGATVHRAGFASLKEAFNCIFPGKIQRGELASSKPGRAGFLTRCLAFFNDNLWRPFYWPDDAALWYFPARRLARRLLSAEKFDAVVSVSLPFTGHLVGHFVRKKFPETRWLVDVGDPISFQQFPLQNPVLYGKLTQRIEKKVLLAADAVAVTNSEMAKVYQEFYAIPSGKIWVVLPISTSSSECLPIEISTRKEAAALVNIAFFGTFFRGVREPDVLLDLMNSLPEDWRARVRFHVFGPVFHEFENKLAVQPAIELQGLARRDEVFSKMQGMDFLLNIGNSEPHQLPSKLADYLISGLPVLNLCQSANDSFAREAAGHPFLLNLFWEGGRFSAEQVAAFTYFLESNLGWRSHAGFVENQKERFSVRRAAALYLDLISGKTKTATR